MRIQHPFHTIAFSLVALCCAGAVCAADLPPNVHLPSVAPALQDMAARFDEHSVVLRPDKDEPEWWAGAPSVAIGGDGVFWMACRMRTAESQRGLRGYEIRILRSDDGVHFEKAHAIQREDVPIPGFERPALLRDPETGLFKLYGCGPWQDGPWGIFKFNDVAVPTEFDPASAELVLGPPEKAYPRDISVIEYKDPVIKWAGGAYHCYVTGYMRRNERLYHYTSDDGVHWEPVGNPYKSIMPLSGWHDFFVRPASLVPLGAGYLFVYEGGSTTWYDPVYNIATGLGFTFDLHTIHDLTPESPLLVSSTPSDTFAVFRYSDWHLHDGTLWVYAEAACPDNTHEIRVYQVPLDETAHRARVGGAPPWADEFAARIYHAWAAGETMPQLSAAHPEAALEDGYAVQNRHAARMRRSHGIGGYKAAVVGAAGQENLGITGPVTGVVPATGILYAEDGIVIDLAAYPNRALETEIGYTFHTAITEPLASTAALRKHVEAIAPIIEVPGGKTEDKHPSTAADLAAFNGNAKALIVGAKHDPETLDPDAVEITMTHDGAVFNEARGGQAAGGQWATLLKTVNNLTGRGFTIGTDHVITNGALGKIKSAEVGRYKADYGELGVVEFQIIDTGK